jgi:hypothetical protein
VKALGSQAKCIHYLVDAPSQVCTLFSSLVAVVVTKPPHEKPSRYFFYVSDAPFAELHSRQFPSQYSIPVPSATQAKRARGNRQSTRCHLCLGVGASQPAAVAADKPKTAMSMSFLASPFFVVLTDLVTKEAKETGLNWTQTTDAQSDAGKQISDIQALVNSGVKGLIVVPRDSDAIAPALNFAETNGVTVVAVDVGINTGKAAITVRADNVAMAQSAPDEIGQHLNGKGKILELQGDLLNTSGRERTEGFEQRMKEKYPGNQIIARGPSRRRWSCALRRTTGVANGGRGSSCGGGLMSRSSEVPCLNI